MKDQLNLAEVKQAAAQALGRESWEPCQVGESRAWRKRVSAYLKLKMAAESGNKVARAVVEEAMSTSDFPQLLGDTMNREVRANYDSWAPVWPSVAARRVVNDYRSIKSFAPNALNGLASKVGEFGSNTPTKNKQDRTPVTYELEDWAMHAKVSRRALINDDVGEFANIPSDFGQGMRNTEDYQFTSTFIQSDGPIFSTAVTQLTSNPVFGVNGLKAALTQMFKSVDPISGMPILQRAPVLMFGPGLTIDVREVIRAASIELTPSLGATARAIMTENWVDSFIANAVPNPWIPYIQSSNEDTTWLLFPSPALGRAAVEAAFLRGMEEPRVYVKSSNQQRVGGGPAPITDGQFEAPVIEYKCEHTFKFAAVAPNLAFGSKGTGS